METMTVLAFLFIFIRFARASRRHEDAVLKLVDQALGSSAFVAVVDLALPFVLEVIRLSA